MSYEVLGERKGTVENPYVSPTVETPSNRQSGWVIQVRVVAVLLIIQGVFEGGMALLLIYQWRMSMLSVLWVVAATIFAVLKIGAGAMNCQYRRRSLGLFALMSAPLSVLTLFCFPTAMLIMVYGFVVYFNGDVKLAFSAQHGVAAGRSHG